MINFACIEPSIFIGSAPQSSVDINRLKQMKVTSVLSLQTDADFRSHRIDWQKLETSYDYNSIQVHRFPINDFDEADMANKLQAAVTTLNSLLEQGQRVYVHCNAGICRAPATVLGYFCHYRGMNLEEGLEEIRKERPQANPYLGAVEKTLDSLAAA